MAIEQSASDERISFEDYLIRVRQDPEHAYEYLDGRITMMTGGSPNHAIIGSNVNGILRERLRGRRCMSIPRMSIFNSLSGIGFAPM